MCLLPVDPPRGTDSAVQPGGNELRLVRPKGKLAASTPMGAVATATRATATVAGMRILLLLGMVKYLNI